MEAHPESQSTTEASTPRRRSPDRWIAACAVVIALAALAFTINESRLAREHMRRSSQPELLVSFWYTKEWAGFRMSNAGLGPAQLKWFSVMVDGEAQPHWRQVFRALDFDPIPKYGFTVPGTFGWFTPDFNGRILTVAPGPAYQALKQLHPLIDIRGCYCSIYDDCWEFSRSGTKVPVANCDNKPQVEFTAPPPRSEGNAPPN